MKPPIPAALVLLLLGACSAGPGDGPAEVADGVYTLLATSASQTPDAATSLTIDGDQVAIWQAGAEPVVATLGAVGDTQYVLCPPGGTGSPRPLGRPVEVGGLALERPALFGDCGQTRPVRVTVVDLASMADQAFFTSWVEFCDSTDPDC